MDTNEIISAITDKVKDTANVSVVFGDAIETAGVTIIPVASVKVSGGGGGGRSRMQKPENETQDGNQSGVGLGVSVTARPLGYIEVKEGEARFIPTPDVTKIAVGGMMTAGMLLMTINRAMRFRAWKAHRKMMRKPMPAEPQT